MTGRIKNSLIAVSETILRRSEQNTLIKEMARKGSLNGSLISTAPSGNNALNQWENLTDRIVRRIFSFLTSEEVFIGRFTCRRWSTAALPIQINNYLKQPGFNIQRAAILANTLPEKKKDSVFFDIVMAHVEQPEFDINKASAVTEKIDNDFLRHWTFGDIITAYTQLPGFDPNIAIAIAGKMSNSSGTIYSIISMYINQIEFNLHEATSLVEKVSDADFKDEAFSNIVRAYLHRQGFDISTAIALTEKITDEHRRPFLIKDIIEAYVQREGFDIKIAAAAAEKTSSDVFKTSFLQTVVRTYIGQRKFDVNMAIEIAQKVPFEEEKNSLLSNIKIRLIQRGLDVNAFF